MHVKQSKRTVIELTADEVKKIISDHIRKNVSDVKGQDVSELTVHVDYEDSHDYCIGECEIIFESEETPKIP